MSGTREKSKIPLEIDLYLSVFLIGFFFLISVESTPKNPSKDLAMHVALMLQTDRIQHSLIRI